MKPEEIQLLSHYQIRTTGEPVFVVGHSDKPGRFEIIRPVQTSEDGIIHTLATVFAEELETRQQQAEREINEEVYRAKLAGEAQQQLQQAMQTSDTATPKKPIIIKPN